MKRRVEYRSGIALLLGGLSLLATSCSIVPANERGAPSRSQQFRMQQHIAQLYFGRDAAYGVCVEPACPAVTRKTIAAAAPPQVPPVAPATLPAASTDAPPKREHLMLRFQPGASTLDARARQELARMVPIARQADKIIIMGRTDNVGPAKVNHSIALARALNVRDYLRSRMKDVDNAIEIDAKGACCFLSKNDTADGRQANRRVEIVFTLRG